MFKNTFQSYIKSQDFKFALIEREAIPSAPANPNNTSSVDKSDFAYVKQFLNIDDDVFSNSIQNNTIQVLVPDFSKKWGFLVGGTCGAVISARHDGNYDVKFLLKSKKDLNPRSFFLPNRDQNNKPILYDGEVHDFVEILSKDDLESIFSRKLIGDQ